MKALEAISSSKESKKFNLGNGKGFSVREVIHAAEEVTGKQIQVLDAGRRDGDPAVLVANSSAISKELNWEPKYTDIRTIIKHAWEWEKKTSMRLSFLLVHFTFILVCLN